MMILNRERAIGFLRHASRLSHHFLKHAKAQEAIRVRLKEIRRTAGRQLREHIQTVDARIAEAVDREKTILARQALEEETHNSLRSRINALERALTQYVAYQQGRSKRLKAVEKRVKKQHFAKKAISLKPASRHDKKTVLEGLRAQLTRLEMLHKEAQEESNDPERLAIIEQKIAILRQKVSE